MMEILEGKEKKKKIRFISRLLHPGQKNEGAAQAETAEQVAKASSESSNGVTREKSAEQVAKELSKSRKGTTFVQCKNYFHHLWSGCCGAGRVYFTDYGFPQPFPIMAARTMNGC